MCFLTSEGTNYCKPLYQSPLVHLLPVILTKHLLYVVTCSSLYSNLAPQYL